MSSANSILKFCPKCQTETERYTNGRCKACLKAAKTAWRKANPEKQKAATAAWRVDNSERVKEGSAGWYAANPERKKGTAAAWAKANPEACRTHTQNRRARKIENGGVLSSGLPAKLFKLQKGKCPCCNLPLGDDYHMDHKMPLALGGPNVDDNMQLLRSTCNQQKSKKHPIDFMQSRGFLL